MLIRKYLTHFMVYITIISLLSCVMIWDFYPFTPVQVVVVSPHPNLTGITEVAEKGLG